MFLYEYELFNALSTPMCTSVTIKRETSVCLFLLIHDIKTMYYGHV